MCCAIERRISPTQTTAGGSRARWISHQSINRSNQRTFPFGSTDIPTQQQTTTIAHPDDLEHPLQSSFPTSPDSCPPIPPIGCGKKQRVERGRRSETSSRFFGSNPQRAERDKTTVTTSFHCPLCALVHPPLSPESDPKKRQLFEFQGRSERICFDHEISGIPLNPHTNTTGGQNLNKGEHPGLRTLHRP